MTAGVISINMSCCSCRKAKPADMGMVSCRHREGGVFNAICDCYPCEEWVPSKSDVRLWIQREGEQENKMAQTRNLAIKQLDTVVKEFYINYNSK